MGRYNILRFEELDSTNLYALRNLERLDDKQVVVAEVQTVGRGRFQRKWVSHIPDNLYMSLVLKPGLEKTGPRTPLPSLTQYMAVVISDVLDLYGAVTALKWPNDVMVKNSKIAGLLGECGFEGSRVKGYVIGAGVNLNMTRHELESIDKPALSLNQVTGVEVDRDEFLRLLLDRFFMDYDEFLQSGFSSIREKYIEKCEFLGKRITVSTLDGAVSGDAGGFNDDGALIIIKDSGEIITVTAGDVV
jgi:BirA family biotin operon repressor/biotin-[acetyl-CoA-carboxylase] ligase